MMVGKGTVVRSMLWKLMERGSIQLVSFVVTLVLARIMGPTEYGLVSLVTVFTSLAAVIVDGGFSSALIQRKDADEVDYSSALVLTVAISGILYLALLLAAPAIADMYSEPRLVAITRAIAALILIGAFNSIQVAFASKHFMFRQLFVSNLLSSVLSGFIGIVLALQGLGVWALVAQQLARQTLACIVMFVTVGWKPTFAFSFDSVKDLFSFGKNVLAGNLLVSFFLNVRSMIIGLICDATVLGYFNRGRQFSSTMMEAIGGSIQDVLFPTFAVVQDDTAFVKKLVRRAIRLSCFVIFPLMFGLAVCGPALVEVLLGEAWTGCVPYLQLFAISYLFHPIQTITAQALRGIGNSNTTLRIELVRKTIEFLLLIISIPLGPLAFAGSAIVSGMLGCLVAMGVNQRELNYVVREQFGDVAFPLIASMLMCASMTVSVVTVDSGIVTLALQVLIGPIAYFFLSKAAHREELGDLFAMLRERA